MTDDDYFAELVLHFPSLSDIVEEDSSMIHFKMERFAEFTNIQIKRSNLLEVSRCFSFQEARIDYMSQELLNALNVSYCEALLLGEEASKMHEIIKIMPPKLLSTYLSYEKYYHELCKKRKD